MGTGKLLKVLLGSALALLLTASAWAEELNYIEAEEGNPELPSATPSSGDLELPLLPPLPEAEPEVVPAPEPPAEEAAPPIEEPIEEPLLQPAAEEEEVVEIEVPVTTTAEVEMVIPQLPAEQPTEIAVEVPVTAEVTTAETTDVSVQLHDAGSLLYSGDTAGAVNAFKAIVDTPGLEQDVYASAVAGYAASLRAAGRRTEAEQWFQEALTYNPDDPALRLAFAYTLAESDKLDRALYQLDLIEQAAPGSGEVTLARARAYAWSGQYEEALRLYSQVTDPKLADEAELGSAYALYWLGRETESRAMLADVPQDSKDARELHALLGSASDDTHGTYAYGGNHSDKARGSFVIGHRNTDDSEDNIRTGTSAVLNLPVGPRGASIFISHEDFELENSAATLTSSGTNTRIGFSAPLDEKGTRVTGYFGQVSIDNSGGQTIDHTDIGVSLGGPLSCDWSYNIAFSDDLLHASPALAAEGVSLQNIALSTKFGVLDDNTTLELMYDTGELSDGNSRSGYAFDLRRAVCYDCRAEFAYGLRGRSLSYADSIDNAYFSPDSYELAELYFDWLDASDSDVKLDANLGVGMQRIGDGDWQSTLRWALGLRAELSRSFILRTGFGASNIPEHVAFTGEEYDSQSWWVNGEWQF